MRARAPSVHVKSLASAVAVKCASAFEGSGMHDGMHGRASSRRVRTTWSADALLGSSGARPRLDPAAGAARPFASLLHVDEAAGLGARSLPARSWSGEGRLDCDDAAPYGGHTPDTPVWTPYAAGVDEAMALAARPRAERTWAAGDVDAAAAHGARGLVGDEGGARFLWALSEAVDPAQDE